MEANQISRGRTFYLIKESNPTKMAEHVKVIKNTVRIFRVHHQRDDLR